MNKNQYDDLSISTAINKKLMLIKRKNYNNKNNDEHRK